MTVDVSLRRLADASEHGARWFVENRREDGFPDSTEVGLQASYRVVWALALNGYTTEARALGQSLERRLDADGDIPEVWQNRRMRHYLSPNAYLVLGAQAIGLDSLSRPLYRFLCSRRDPEMGGFYSQPPDVAGRLSMDTASAALVGLAALAMGDLPIAEGAARFLRHAFERQPEPTVAFYTGVSPSGEVVSAPELLTELGPDDRPRRIRIKDPDQAWYFIGLPAAFLAALHETTKDPSTLELGLLYFDYLANDCYQGSFTEPSSGKSGVGAAHLYRLTGDPGQREIALVVADSILEWQEPRGCWRWEPEDPPDGPLEPHDVDLTAEHVIWLHHIRAYLER